MHFGYASVKFCGDAPVDPNAATTSTVTGESVVATYTCSTGYEDSISDKTYIGTCTSGSWVLTGDGPCGGEYSIGNLQRTVSWYPV